MQSASRRNFAFFSLAFVFTACASSPYPVSDHFDGKRFFNPGVSKEKNFWDFLRWQMTSQKVAWPQWRDAQHKPVLTANRTSDGITVDFINHATFLIRTPRLNILTDPIYSDRASPVSFSGPKRVAAPGIPFEKLPAIDVVLISHNHYDHMNGETIDRLTKAHNPLFIAPLGNGALIQSLGGQGVVELDWWQDLTPPDTAVSIIMVPARHWSARGLFDRNLALWSGFVIRTEKERIYFAGDTAYGPLFKEIRSRLGVMDLSILPIGAYAPRWFMQDSHMNPDDAVLAHIDLESKLSLAAHFGTFSLGDEGIDDPVHDLRTAIETRKVNPSSFFAPAHGESFAVNRSVSNQISESSNALEIEATDN
jgi:L-ascorbate metabolism protein UlaG (beta-lactamase superfamily)